MIALNNFAGTMGLSNAIAIQSYLLNPLIGARLTIPLGKVSSTL